MAHSIPAFLDHIVILVPHSWLAAPPEWMTENFTISPGGKHADGLTENVLVLLADGVYLEFMAFVPGIDPEKRKAHRWGLKEEGTIIDWAFSLPESAGTSQPAAQETLYQEIQKAIKDAGAGAVYGDLVKGGRLRPDGVELKWAVAGPFFTSGDPVEPGQLPFWCLDVTPRDNRVPYRKSGQPEHPSGLVGVASVDVFPGSSPDKGAIAAVFDAFLSKSGAASASWALGSLEPKGKLHQGGSVIISDEAWGAPTVTIALFTKNSELAGSEFGGKVNEKHSLVFKLHEAVPGA